MIHLDQAIKMVCGNVAQYLQAEKKMCMDKAKFPSLNTGLINASVPLARRERRALKRKEKKHGNTK